MRRFIGLLKDEAHNMQYKLDTNDYSETLSVAFGLEFDIQAIKRVIEILQSK